jgi:hypothetical protein
MKRERISKREKKGAKTAKMRNNYLLKKAGYHTSSEPEAASLIPGP